MNGEFLDIAKGELQNVGQCFSKIEPGAYFPGDAYAIYGNMTVSWKFMLIFYNFTYLFLCCLTLDQKVSWNLSIVLTCLGFNTKPYNLDNYGSTSFGSSCWFDPAFLTESCFPEIVIYVYSKNLIIILCI